MVHDTRVSSGTEDSRAPGLSRYYRQVPGFRFLAFVEQLFVSGSLRTLDTPSRILLSSRHTHRIGSLGRPPSRNPLRRKRTNIPESKVITKERCPCSLDSTNLLWFTSTNTCNTYSTLVLFYPSISLPSFVLLSRLLVLKFL